MTTATTFSPPVHRAGLARRAAWALAAEWTKLRSVRSTVWALVAAFVVETGLAALFCYGQVRRWDRVPARLTGPGGERCAAGGPRPHPTDLLRAGRRVAPGDVNGSGQGVTAPAGTAQ